MLHQKNFIVYKSSAGSGKTFTLVKEYLKLALVDKNNLKKAYKYILAITFTNKAASEMKARIIKALKEISNSQNDFLTNLVADELLISSDDLKERAELVLTEVLHNYSDFSIGTIDSFTHRIIRTFALDLKLPLNFQIETDVYTVFNKVISLLINNIGKDKLLTEYLLQYSLSNIDDNKDWNPEKSLLDFITEINKEGANEMVAQLGSYSISDFEKIKEELLSNIKNYKQFLKTHGEIATQLFVKENLNETCFYQGNKGIYNFFNKLVKGETISKTELFNSYVNATLEEDKWFSAKVSESEKAQIETIKPQLLTVVDAVIQKLNDEETQYNLYLLIRKNIYAIGLVNELAKLTAEYKTEENILFISEFNQRISNVVSNEPTPFIFERLGDRYKHFLLDEFQDTSSMQWQNMLPLIDNSLGNGNLNLIVGDGKQSIYRWRNADVEQFVNLPNIHIANKSDVLQEREESLIRNYDDRILNTNFRSDSVIVKFNNLLFDYLPAKYLGEELKSIYKNQEQQDNKKDTGYVSIDFAEVVANDKDECNLRLTLQYIQQALQDGYTYQDICVIVRANTNGSTVANFLISQNIPVVSAESLLLANANEITILLAFLKYLANHNDLVSASVVINYLYQLNYCTEEKHIEYYRDLNQKKSKNIFSILQKCGIICDEVKVTSSNIFETCVLISDSLHLNKLNPQYIRFFLDEVLTFLQNNTSNINLFLDWWEKKNAKASVIIPEGINAVNIMTIHASKGLEFPIVITPYIGGKIERQQSLWVNVTEPSIDLPVALIAATKAAEETEYKPLIEKEKQQQALDNINVLYVDFTRAVNRLHIISPKPKIVSEKDIHTWLVEFAKTQGHYIEADNKLTFGKFTSKELITHQKTSLQQISSPDLKFNLTQSAVKIKGASQYNYNEDVELAREYGILMHYILSQVHSKKNIPEVIHTTYLKGDITEIEAAKMTVDITELLNLPTISPYFSEDVIVKNELEILTQEGEILRPDRVVIINNTATVIDYKTGKKQIEKHYNQMQAYQQALLDLGYSSVNKVLLYIHEKEAIFI